MLFLFSHILWASLWSLHLIMYRVDCLSLLIYLFFLDFSLFFCLKHIPVSPHFASSVFISMYLVVWLCFLILEKWPCVGDILWGPAAPSSHQSCILRACPLCAPWALLPWPAGYCGHTGWCGESLALLVAGPVLVWSLLTAGGWGQVLSQLVAWSEESQFWHPPADGWHHSPGGGVLR